MKKSISLTLFICMTAMLSGCSVYNSSYNASNDSVTSVSSEMSATETTLNDYDSSGVYSSSDDFSSALDSYEISYFDEQSNYVYTDAPVVTENFEYIPVETNSVSISIAGSNVIDDDIVIPHPSPNIYGYTPKFYQLTSDEQIAYDEIAKGIILFKEEIVFSVKLTETQFLKVYQAVMTTMEQQFYAPVREYTMVCVESTGLVHAIKPNYGYTQEELDIISQAVSTKADEIISMISSEMSSSDIIKLFHDTIILNCNYSSDNVNSGNAYGALVDGSAICEGYSRAMAYLCNKVNIPCEIITGTASGVSHMWNMVEIDGKWYHIDLTWDDPVFNPIVYNYISYTYFNVTDSQIQKTHLIDSNDFVYPVAYCSDANYFVFYNLYIDNSENANEIIYNGISSAIANNQNFAVFRFDNQQIFDEINSNLFNDAWEGFFSIIDEYNSVNEVKIDKSNISIKKDVNEFIVRIAF